MMRIKLASPGTDQKEIMKQVGQLWKDADQGEKTRLKALAEVANEKALIAFNEKVAAAGGSFGGIGVGALGVMTSSGVPPGDDTSSAGSDSDSDSDSHSNIQIITKKTPVPVLAKVVTKPPAYVPPNVVASTPTATANPKKAAVKRKHESEQHEQPAQTFVAATSYDHEEGEKKKKHKKHKSKHNDHDE